MIDHLARGFWSTVDANDHPICRAGAHGPTINIDRPAIAGQAEAAEQIVIWEIVLG